MHADPADLLRDGLRHSLSLGHTVGPASAPLHMPAPADRSRQQELEGELAAVEADPNSSTAALVGCAGGGARDGALAGAIASVDLAAGTSRGTYVQEQVAQC
jgi:hypothetical protein